MHESINVSNDKIGRTTSLSIIMSGEGRFGKYGADTRNLQQSVI